MSPYDNISKTHKMDKENFLDKTKLEKEDSNDNNLVVYNRRPRLLSIWNNSCLLIVLNTT